jgi:putative peptide zinc metalloprotease protein
MRRLATLTVLLATLAAASSAAAPAPAAAAGGDNSAIAINTRDDTEVFRLAFDIRRAMTGVVDHQNAAVAYASCDGCTAIAIAMQAVLVGVQADTVTPANLALAITEQCTLCTAMASAYQFVLGTDGPAHFTPDGNRAISDIRGRLGELRHAQLSPAELDARLSALYDELGTVLRDELVTPDGGQYGPVAPEPAGEHGTEAPAAEPAPEQTQTTPEAPPPDGAATAPSEPPDETETTTAETEPAPEGTSTVPDEGTASPQQEPTDTGR